MRSTALIAVLLLLTVEPGRSAAGAQTLSDDPAAPRNSVSYMSSDLVRQMSRVRPSLDPTSERVLADHLPMGDVRFGAAPALRISSMFALLAEGGVAARFLLDRSHFAAIDFNILGLVTASVGLPRRITDLVCDVGRPCVLQVGAGVRHVSAHGGDEYMTVENLPFLIYSRDGLVGRVSVETGRAGARFEIIDDARAYGIGPGTQLMYELWVRPLLATGLRVGGVRKDVPAIDEVYQAAYVAMPFRISNIGFEARARATRGATPIGFAYQSFENSVGIELIIR